MSKTGSRVFVIVAWVVLACVTGVGVPVASAEAPAAENAATWPPRLSLSKAKRCRPRDLEWSQSALGPLHWETPHWTKPQPIDEWLRDMSMYLYYGKMAEQFFGIGTPPRRIVPIDGFPAPDTFSLAERGPRVYSVKTRGTLYYGWWTGGTIMTARDWEMPRRWALRVVTRSLDSRRPGWGFDLALGNMMQNDFRSGDPSNRRMDRKHRAEFVLDGSPWIARSLTEIEVDYGPPHLTRPDGIATYALFLVHDGRRVKMNPGDCVDVLNLPIPMTLALITAWSELEPRDIPLEERIGFIEFRLWANPPGAR